MKNKNPSLKTVLISSIPGINCFSFYQQRLAPGVQSIMLNLTSHKLRYNNNAALTKHLADLMLAVMDRTSRASFSQYSYRTCLSFSYRKMFYLPNVFRLQCSEPCGYGIQSRAVSCMGPSTPEPLSPLLCMHMPKPITIQGCSMGSCNTERPAVLPILRHTDTQPHHNTPPSPTEAVTIRQASPTTTPIPQSS